jgi:peptide deformylase
MKLPIITYPHPTLSKVAQAVQFPLALEDQALITSMWQTVDAIGVGLAAPQVDVSKQICIINMNREMVKNKKQKLRFVVINPKIIKQTGSCNMVEGCLSFPDEYWQIIRPSQIEVEFWDENGKKQKLKADGWLARVLLHEIDHLNGNLFINQGGKKLDKKDIEGQIID